LPMQTDRYPADWDAIALAIKEAAQWRCQDCGMQCRRPHEPFDTHKRTMSVAHLNHDPADCRHENLAAWCSACHLRYDAPMHAIHAAETRRRKKVAAGQMELSL
jgi:hypothetical protein